MKVAIRKITEDVAAILGESLTLECEPEESPFPSLAELVRLCAHDTLICLLQESPRVFLTGWKAFEEKPTLDSDGMAVLPLPADFLMPGSIRLSGWLRSIDTITDEADFRSASRGSIWKGLKGSPERPVAFLDLSPAGERCLKMFPANQGATLLQGWYLPVPELDAQSLEVPAPLYPRLVTKIAETVQKVSPSSSL